MLKKTIILSFCFMLTECQKNGTGIVFARFPSTKTPFPVLFREHVYSSLTDKGKSMFYAVNIQPACVAKKGQCIPRRLCSGREMLYISRACYKRDLVCCYDNSIKFPETGPKFVTPTPRENLSSTTEAYIDPPVLP